MKKTYYHATPQDNVIGKIMREGILPRWDGYVYLAESEVDALKFMYMQYFYRSVDAPTMAVIPIVLDDSEVEESFDHNQEWYGCRAWKYEGTIQPWRFPDIKHINNIKCYNYPYIMRSKTA